MFGKNKNNSKPVINSSGYNGSEPTRVCPHCGKENEILKKRSK